MAVQLSSIDPRARKKGIAGTAQAGTALAGTVTSAPSGAGASLAGAVAPRSSASSSTWSNWPPLAASASVSAGGPVSGPSYRSLLEDLHSLVSNGPMLQAGGGGAQASAMSISAGGPGAEPEIGEGATGQAVRDLQQRLTQLGFNPQGIDGIFGPNTLAAVKAFQASCGIAVDGIVGPQTWGRLDSAGAAPAAPAAPAPSGGSGSGPMLQDGSTGSAVAALQQRLTQLGFNPQGVDGVFGPDTLAAVKAFQASQGITVDGIVGPQTWGRLGINVAGSSPSAPPASSPPPGNFQQAIVAGAQNLVDSGYIYPPNDTNQYYYVPDKVGCCADFACDSVGKAGFDLNQTMSSLGYDPHYCPSMVDYFKSHQQYIAGQTGAQVGDLVFFDWGDGQADHVAVVTQVNAQGVPTQIAESYNFNLPAHITSGVSVGNIMGYGRVVNT